MARFAAALLVATLLGACREPPQPEPIVGWTLIAERTWTRDDASIDLAPQRCSDSGDRCANLGAGDLVAVPATLTTSSGSRASVRLDARAELELAEEAQVRIPATTTRTLSVNRGRVTLSHRAGGESYWLRFAGFSTRVDSDQEVVTSIAATSPDAATLTLYRGELAVLRGLEYTRVRAGQTVRLSAGQAPDLRAVFTGRVAPVARVRTTEPPAGASDLPRGLGRVTARIPGTERVVPGVRLSRHHVSTVITDGYARTEVEEELFNDTDRVLEGRYAFALPQGASLSRLALWVGDELIEGELVERQRAARIFKGIVDDSVRPRDPALLEWVSGRELSLKIFPIEPRKSRRVVLAYNEALPTEASTVRYRYPLDLGRDRATKIDDFALRVRAHDARAPLTAVRANHPAARIGRVDDDATVVFEAQNFVPASDFVVEYGVARNSAPLTQYWPQADGGGLPELAHLGASGYFALQLTAELPQGAPVPERYASDRVIVIDRSFSQGEASLRAQLQITQALLDDLDEGDRFAVLVCDTACDAYPGRGLEQLSAESTAAVQTWLGRVVEPRGASDLAGALVSAAGRIDGDRGGQVVCLGDGRATAGELSASSIARRVRPFVRQRRVDLRLCGIGRTVDDVVLRELAAAVGATYDSAVAEESLERRVDSLILDLRTPVIESPRVKLPATFTEVLPQRLPNLRLGQSILITGKLTGESSGPLRLRGTLAGAPYEFEREVGVTRAASSNPLVPRLWAENQIAFLEGQDDPQSHKEALSLSRSYHVASRHTSLLVLESEQMFAEFGVERTQRRATSGAAPTTWGDEIGESHGGLALSGIGWGGAGRGEELGSSGSGALGRGAAAPGAGFGQGHGRLGGSHRTAAPRVRMGATAVRGALPAEVVQRIVRQSYGRFRMCYEGGLASQPALEGRVITRFVIGSDGRVVHATNAGGDLGDANVVACITRSFYGLTFPEPEGGVVTVQYPIHFSVDQSPSWSPGTPTTQPAWSRPPRVSHHVGTEAWRNLGTSQIAAARKGVTDHPQSRDARQELLRTLIRLGRFADAGHEARNLVRLDPDSAWAHEAAAAAAAADGDGASAARSLASEIELEHRSAAAQMRVARALEAAGDETRACAHWRAAVELDPGRVRARFEAIRCRARAQEWELALDELTALDASDESLGELRRALEGRHAPRYDPERDTPGWFEVRVECKSAAKRCPVPLVLTPVGRLVSPWSPEVARATTTRLALARRTTGRYRTLLVGGDPDSHGELTLVVDGATYTRPFTHGGRVATAVESDVL